MNRTGQEVRFGGPTTPLEFKFSYPDECSAFGVVRHRKELVGGTDRSSHALLKSSNLNHLNTDIY